MRLLRFALLFLALAAHAADWPRWRGPNADGVAPGANPPVSWSQTDNVRWSHKLPGWGTSSGSGDWTPIDLIAGLSKPHRASR